jgi:hypothetical protein
MANTTLAIVDQFRILGVVVDETLSFKQHVTYILSKVNSRIFILKKLYSNHVSEHSRLRFYKACILPVLLYGIEAWYGFLNQTDCERLERAQNTALKLILGPDFSSAERLQMANCSSIADTYHQMRQRLFNNILTEEKTSLHNTVQQYKNNNRRSRTSHKSSTFSYKIRTELFKRSFFIQSFLQSS